MVTSTRLRAAAGFVAVPPLQAESISAQHHNFSRRHEDHESTRSLFAQDIFRVLRALRDFLISRRLEVIEQLRGTRAASPRRRARACSAPARPAPAGIPL